MNWSPLFRVFSIFLLAFISLRPDILIQQTRASAMQYVRPWFVRGNKEESASRGIRYWNWENADGDNPTALIISLLTLEELFMSPFPSN
jgi:hypothetical protein